MSGDIYLATSGDLNLAVDIMAGIVVLAGAIVVLATRGRLGLKRSSAPNAAT
jgi:hypothetical protein